MKSNFLVLLISKQLYDLPNVQFCRSVVCYDCLCYVRVSVCTSVLSLTGIRIDTSVFCIVAIRLKLSPFSMPELPLETCIVLAIKVLMLIKVFLSYKWTLHSLYV